MRKTSKPTTFETEERMHHPRPSQLTGLLLLVLLFAGAQAAAAAPIAQPIVPLLENDTGILGSGSSPQEFENLGERTVFIAAGILWVTQGTPETTESLSSSPLRFVARVGHLLYYLGYGPSGEADLWRTDGTREGTLAISSSLALDDRDFNPFNFSPAVLGQTLYFIRRSNELWRTQGTLETTEKIIEIEGLEKVIAFRESLILITQSALWISDGTSAGTETVAGGLIVEAYHQVRVSGERLYFTSSVNHDYDTPTRLWALDSLDGPPQEIATSRETDFLSILADHQGDLVFLNSSETEGVEIWKVKAGSVTPTQLTSFTEAEPFPRLAENWFWNVNGTSYFLVGPFLPTLWKVEEGVAGQQQISSDCPPANCPSDAYETQRFGNLLVYSPDPPSGEPQTFLITDGNVSGTRPLRDLCTPGCDGPIVHVKAVEDSLFFVSESGPNHLLFRTDGSVGGTFEIGSFRRNDPQDGLVRNGARTPFGWILNLFTSRHGYEPWVLKDEIGELSLLEDLSLPTPGRPLGEALAATTNELVFLTGNYNSDDPDESIEVLRLGPDGSPRRVQGVPESPIRSISTDGNRAFLQVWTESLDVELYLLESPRNETRFLGQFDPPTQLVSWQGKTYFLVERDSTAGLWVTDGTAAGTQRAFGPPTQDFAQYFALHATSRGLLFATFDESGETSLWISDGTEGGSVQLGVLPPGSRVFPPRLSQPLETAYRIYLTSCFNRRQSLWEIDPDGRTVDLVAPVGSCSGASSLSQTDHGVVFMSTQNGNFPRIPEANLWKFEESNSGAGEVIHLARESFDPGPIELTAFAGSTFLPFPNQEYGLELWRTDGSADGTFMVKDLNQGPASSAPTSLTPFGDQLYFTADDGAHGRELWVTDGTEEGTRLVHDIFPGAQSSNPRELTLVEDRLYFTAESGIRLPELWVLPLDGSGPPCRASEETLCLQGQRFQVEAQWRDFQSLRGTGKAVSLSEDTGYFWFFDNENVELVTKVLDGQAINDHYWTFFGALSNVEYWLTVTDTESGLTRRYYNRPRNFASVGDTQSFGPRGASLDYSPAPTTTPSFQPMVESSYLNETSPMTECVPSSQRLCLNGGRFAVEAQWTDFQGNSGAGIAREVTDDTGTFWFFQPSNTELILKVLDGRTLNNRFWVFYGSLSNVDFDITVTDTQSGRVKRYQNRDRQFASVGDTRAF